MTIYKPGEIILIPFPFSDLSGIKKRPALILVVFDSRQELICMMLTSATVETKLDYKIACWQESGLLKPTKARLHRLFTINYPKVITRLGKMKPVEFQEILDKTINLLRKGTP